MFYLPFWVVVAIIDGLLALTLAIRKPRFSDLQIYITAAALAMSSDMLLCKQYDLYYYVNPSFRGWYSFWANLLVVPALGLIFIKWLPRAKGYVPAYIAAWTAAEVIFELFVLKLMEIVKYAKWRIIPHSMVGTFLLLTLLYFYYRALTRRESVSAREGSSST